MYRVSLFFVSFSQEEELFLFSPREPSRRDEYLINDGDDEVNYI